MPTTPRTRRPRRALAVALLVTALAAGLTGCSLDRLGAAAVVGGQPVSTDEVQRLAREYQQVVPGGDGARIQVAILQQLVVTRVLEELSRQAGVRVSDGEVARRLDQLEAQTGGRKELVRAISTQTGQVVPPSMLEEWERGRLLFQRYVTQLAGGTSAQPSQEAVARAQRDFRRTARQLDVEVNPRYGRWQPAGGIRPLVSGGLARAADRPGDRGGRAEGTPGGGR